MSDVRHLTDAEAQLLLEDALDAPVRRRVELHLAGCPDCQATVLSFEALAASLSAMPLAEPPPDFTAGVMARVDHLERSRAADRRAAAAVLGVASLLLAAAVLAAGPAGWASALSAASRASCARPTSATATASSRSRSRKPSATGPGAASSRSAAMASFTPTA